MSCCQLFLLVADARPVRAILHDEANYHNAEAFDPDRFLRADGTLDPDVLDPSDYAFGFGRRLCPGRLFSLTELWLQAACILSAFEIGEARSEDEIGELLTGEYTTGLIRYVSWTPFSCVS